MNQTIFLIFYLWHANVTPNYRGGTGGPILTIQQAPSLAACEQLGKAAKEMVDGLRPSPVAVNVDWENSPPAAYRCVAVNNDDSIPCSVPVTPGHPAPSVYTPSWTPSRGTSVVEPRIPVSIETGPPSEARMRKIYQNSRTPSTLFTPEPRTPR